MTTTPSSPLDEPTAAGEAISPRDAATFMVRIQRIRRDTIEDLVRYGTDAAAKRRDAVKAKARAQLTSRQATVEDRKADAVLVSADAFYEADVADVKVDACTKALFVLRDDWDTARSIGANERADLNATGLGS